MKIPITNNNSSNGKKLTASEEELIEVPVVNYFDAKTYNQSNMKENNIDINIDFTLKNKYVLGVTTIVVMSAILFTLFSGESEADKVARIAKLDYQRQEQLKENEATRQATIDCDLAIKQEMGKDNEIVPCTARTLSGSTIIPKASAMETTNSGTATGATIPVPERVKHTGKLLTPAELFGPTKVADDCYISQTESSHVEVKNGGMFATDIGCKFGATGGVGGKAEVFAPDLRNKVVEYTVDYVGYDALLGSFIQLTYGNEAFYLGHTDSKLKIGDKVKTGQRIGQMILNGATTGWHVHFEYRVKNNSGTWASQRYFTAARETALDNKRKNTMKLDWKWGDTIAATVYDLGDVKQNDASPWVGASGVNLQGHTNTIALTVDIRKSLGIKWGDKVMMCRKDSQEYCVYFEVHDEMNSRFRYACINKDGYCIKMDIARQNSKHTGGAWTLMCKEKECKVGQP